MIEKDEVNTKALKDIIKALEEIQYAKVGILGNKNARSDDGESTNAEIGLKHEFGEDGMPIRSFLRMPIALMLNQELEKSGAFDEEAIKKIKDEKSFKTFIKKIGIVGERCVQKAFDSGGFGQWKKSNMNFKQNKQTLVETQQLRNSITSEVIDDTSK